MTTPRYLRDFRFDPGKLLPGLLLTGSLTAVAYALALLPGVQVIGALGVALLLGLGWRAVFGLPAMFRPGATFSARTLLRVGVVLLGVRLNFALLAEAGPKVLLLDVLVIGVGITAIERIGAWLGLPRALRLAVAVGSSICGASAIAAATPVIGADDDEVSVAVGIVSLLGTLGVVAYTVLGPMLHLSAQTYGMMTGSTLHEVAHVLAAGAAQGAEALDIATVTKLTRVALLAPVLLIVGALLRRAGRGEDTQTGALQAPLLPGFLVGFLAVGVLNSLGVIPRPAADMMQRSSLLLTAASMAGIGLGVDFAVMRRLGAKSALVGVAGFAIILGVAALYVASIA